MIKLWEFYLKNKGNKNDAAFQKLNDYHDQREKNFTFEKNILENLNYSDINSLINAFKDIIKPNFCEPRTVNELQDNELKFTIMCYYFWVAGYAMDEFPTMFAFPKYEEFACLSIKEAARAKYNSKPDGSVSWQSRRRFIDNDLTIKKINNNIDVDESFENLYKSIATSNTDFFSLSEDEKLMNIRNIYENLVDKMGGFKAIKYKEIFMGYISEENLKEYSKKLHIFRHGKTKAIEERASLSLDEKNYMIDFGIVILKVMAKYLIQKKSAV